MAECGVCGNHQKQLYCSGCATHLTLRPRINVLNVNTQLNSLKQSVSNTLEGHSTTDVPASEGSAYPCDSTGNKAHITQLTTKTELLTRKLKEIQQHTNQTKRHATMLRQKTQLIRSESDKLRTLNTEVGTIAHAQYDEYIAGKRARENELEKCYKDMLYLSLGLQTKCCHELLDIFSLKKKRKKVGYEIVLGSNIVPELTQLGHYSVTTINSGMERVATFIMLLASYLGIRLPHDIILPRKSQPFVLIGTSRESLVLPHSVKTMMRSSTREFHHYCSLLGMLVLDVTHVALKLGIPGINDLEDVVKIHQLIAQIYLRLEGLIKQSHQIKIYSGFVPADIESVQDHLITAIDIEMNGKSAEWNIIDAPYNLPSESNEVKISKTKVKPKEYKFSRGKFGKSKHKNRNEEPPPSKQNELEVNESLLSESI